MRAVAMVIGLLCACGDNVEVTAIVTIQPVRVLADGRAKGEIVVRLVERDGVPVRNQRVELAVTGTGNQLEPADPVTDDLGVAVATMRATVGESKTISVSALGVSASVEARFDPVSAPCAGQPRFTLPVISDHGRFAADVNNDGKLDLVTSSPQVPGVGFSVVLGLGDGTFQAPLKSAIGSTLEPLAAGDFDADGNLDIVARAVDGSIVELRGNGAGTFASPASVTSGDYSRAATGDVDGDGKVDLVVWKSNVLHTYFGNGDGTLSPTPVILGAPLSSLGSVSSGDFNRDGRLDIIFSSTGGVRIAMFSGNDRTPTLSTIDTFASVFAVGDFDNDSILDVINGGTLWLGRGDGTFAAVNTQLEVPVPMIAGNFVGDAGDDVLSAGSDPQVFTFDGGEFRVAFPFRMPIVPMWTADLDGNGRDDLVTPVDGMTAITLAADGFQQPTYVHDGGATVAGDFDNDGATDLVSSTSFHELRWSRNVGDGTFEIVERHDTWASPVGTGDLDRDGWLDVVLLEDPAMSGWFNEIGIALGRDGEWLSSRTRYPLVQVGGNVRDVVVADIDGDHRRDLIAIGSQGPSDLTEQETLYLLRGNGDGTFREPEALEVGANRVRALLAVDLENDGITDIVGVTIAKPDIRGEIVWWRGRGDGSFEPRAPWFSLRTMELIDWMLVDEIDAVPGLDAIVHVANRAHAFFFPGDRSGRPQVALPIAGAAGRLVDVDRDGVLDLATGGTYAFVLRGNAKGGFQPMTSFAAWPAIADDFDRDGKLDFLTPNFHLVETDCVP